MARNSRGLRPSPAIVVAIMALVAAVAGTAVAGPGATSSKITKKKVTKIAQNVANQQISARESGLRVAHAVTSDNANNANTANTATNATNATNAQKAADADALSGNTIVAEGDIDGPGALGGNGCTSVPATATGAQAGDHVLVTPPAGWPTYDIGFSGRVTGPNQVAYDLCNDTATLQNFGTAPPIRFLVIR
jgi:type II secretory pathway pseudopilin PulG